MPNKQNFLSQLLTVQNNNKLINVATSHVAYVAYAVSVPDDQ